MKKIRLILVAAFMFVLAPVGQTQWSVGAPGTRQAPEGRHRYAFMVFANPRAGQEQQFNDWYDYEHLGDLVQLPGWTGAQRFRLVSQMNPRPTERGYQFNYLAWWDQEAADPYQPRAALDKAQDGGKARRSDTFDYYAGGSPKALYEVLGPRLERKDGRKMSIPAADDNVSVRPNRFFVLDLSDRPATMSVEAYEAALSERTTRGLTLPGWIAAQRLRAIPTPGPRGRPDENSPFPADLIVWEVEAASAQAASDAFAAAVKNAGLPAPAEKTTAIMSFWQPIGPYVDRQAFAR